MHVPQRVLEVLRLLPGGVLVIGIVGVIVGLVIGSAITNAVWVLLRPSQPDPSNDS